MLYQFTELAKWSKIVGWITFIGGIISAITGFFAFIIGAIPGVIGAIIGWKLIKAAESAMMLATEPQNDMALYDMAEKYTTYFKILGILLIISIAFSLLGMLAGLSVVGGMFGRIL